MSSVVAAVGAKRKTMLRVGLDHRIWSYICLPLARSILMPLPLRWGSSSASSASARAWYRVAPITTYLIGMKWLPYRLPLALGVVLISYQRFRTVKKQNGEQKLLESNGLVAVENYATNIEISLIKFLPLRIVSRCWGIMNSIYLPIWMRQTLIGSYSHTFGCELSEAEIDDLRAYRNLGEFFRRNLRPGVRPIANGNVIVSPTDGMVVNFGKLEKKGQIEKVKGHAYDLRTFLGPQTWNGDNNNSNTVAMEGYEENLLKNKQNGTDLFQCVIYLAPGDYHKFHSPAEWSVNFRRHFPGKLLSVKPSFVNWLPGVFNLNERVVYVGEWLHGFCSMIAVGATNVGSIKVPFDEDLMTNRTTLLRRSVHHDKPFHENPVPFGKGQSFGEFNLGSTVVLVFEAPSDFKFEVQPGDKIKYGQLLCGNLKAESS